MESSRRFGVFFMQFFQVVMAARSSVAVRVKKFLTLSWSDKLSLIDPLIKHVEDLVENGVVFHRNSSAECSDGEELPSLLIDKSRESGFSKKQINTTNSISNLQKLNCVICNHKLDPQYIIHLFEYYQSKQENGSSSSKGRGEEEEEGDDDDSDYEIMLDGSIIKIPSNLRSDQQFSKKISIENKNLKKSPHANIWSGRNQWFVKDKLTFEFYSTLNRFRQELLITAYRKER